MGLSPRSPAVFVLLAATVLVSCVGIESDTNISADGSGTIALQYRVSRLTESMGKMESGERWLPFPVDRLEFERAIDRIGGLSITSFSQSADETDVMVRANIAFRDLDAFSRFLNATGRSAVINESGGKHTATFRLSDGGGPLDPDLKKLVDVVFKGYSVSLRFRFLSVPSVQGGGAVDAETKTAIFSSPVVDILSSAKPLVWIVSW